jgi:hypothetical protein
VSLSGLANGVPTIADVLSSFQADLGLLANLPGVTIDGIRYTLSVRPSIAVEMQVTWGFIVTQSTVDNVDIDPLANPHLDWMEWRHIRVAPAAANQPINLVGLGDAGYYRTAARRKLKEIQDTCFFAINATAAGGTWGYELGSSAALMLP